jgi:hypothetical protein
MTVPDCVFHHQPWSTTLCDATAVNSGRHTLLRKPASAKPKSACRRQAQVCASQVQYGGGDAGAYRLTLVAGYPTGRDQSLCTEACIMICVAPPTVPFRRRAMEAQRFTTTMRT